MTAAKGWTWTESGRLSRDEYRRRVLGFWGDRLRSIEARTGVPLDDLIFDPNRAFSQVRAVIRAEERVYYGVR